MQLYVHIFRHLLLNSDFEMNLVFLQGKKFQFSVIHLSFLQFVYLTDMAQYQILVQYQYQYFQKFCFQNQYQYQNLTSNFFQYQNQYQDQNLLNLNIKIYNKNF